MTTATLDPAEAMTTAITDAYDQLRQVLEKFAGRRDDPQLLEEVGTVKRRALGRYNRAKKKTEPPAEKPRAAEPAPAPSKPAPAEPKPVAPVAAPAAVAPSAKRVSVRLDAVDKPRVPGERLQVASQPPAGRHRAPESTRAPWWARRPLPWRAHVLIIGLLVLGAAGTVATYSPLGAVVGFVLAMVLYAVAPRRWRRRGHRATERPERAR